MEGIALLSCEEMKYTPEQAGEKKYTLSPPKKPIRLKDAKMKCSGILPVWIIGFYVFPFLFIATSLAYPCSNSAELTY